MFDIVPKSTFSDTWSPLSVFRDLDSVFKTSSSIHFLEEDDYTVVECDLPGIEKDQVKIVFNSEKGYVTVEAENKSEKNKRKYRYRFNVDPDDIDSSVDPQLELKNGVLTIKFRKSERRKREDEKERVLRVE